MFTPKRLTKAANAFLTSVVETNKGQLKRVPNHILGLVLFLCVSVLAQGIADVVLKLMSYSPLLPDVPWRTDFLFLTAISVLTGYRTLSGMRYRKFDVTRNSIELGFLVETALIVGDVEFIYKNMAEIPHVFAMRMPFIVLTAINIVILMYSYRVLELQRWPHLR